MKVLIRSAILLAAAGGFCVAIATASQADVVEPTSAYQPASVGLLTDEAKADMADPAATDAAAAEQQKAAEEAAAKEEKTKATEEPPVATPAPEQVVRQVPPHLVHAVTQQPAAPSVAERVMHPLRFGFRHIGAALGRVVSACEVGGTGTATGGPVLVLAVLVGATPFIRRRVFATRRTTDEAVPDLLYAWELTPPG